MIFTPFYFLMIYVRLFTLMFLSTKATRPAEMRRTRCPHHPQALTQPSFMSYAVDFDANHGVKIGWDREAAREKRISVDEKSIVNVWIGKISASLQLRHSK